MRLHLVQLDTLWEDKPGNFERVRGLVLGAQDPVSPGDLVVLPELFDTGFSFNLDRTADRDDQTRRYLLALAAETGAVIHGSRTVLDHEGRGRNQALVVGPGGGDGAVLCEYDKVHPFSYGRESRSFSGGRRVVTYGWSVAGDGVQTEETSLTVCPAVCYDLRFPELFRYGLLAGAEAFVIGANWPAERAEHRRTLTIARAIENQAYVVCVNRAGADPHLTYGGGSLVVGPRGEVVCELDDRERVVSVDIDPSEVAGWREIFPAWKDVRMLRADGWSGR